MGSFIFSQPALAEFDLECYLKNNCNGGGGWGRASSNPSSGSQVKINPSAVPTEAGFGVEAILFKTDIDIALVRGLGRVGAAISPSNSEETFFGPPGFELPENYLARKYDSKKYPNQKVTLAAAFSLIDNKGSGLGAFSLKLGAMGKYNKFTSNASPGGGLNGILGPFTFGGSIYSDETQLDYGIYGSTAKPTIAYQVQTYNVGLFLSSIILDYSHLALQNAEASTVTLLTASLLVKKFIITASKRIENSSRPSFNYETKVLENKPTKEEVFGGVQYSATKNIMVGALYNYYLMRELALTTTIFF